MIVQTLHLSDNGKEKKFRDVKGDEWFATAVKLAAQAGYMSGGSDGSFRPKDTVTREELAVILVRTLESVKKLPDAGDPILYSDHTDISSWARSSVYKGKISNVMIGLGNDRFAPAGKVSRAEAAQGLMQVLIAMQEIQAPK